MVVALADVQAEKAQRELCRRSLWHFALRFYPGVRFDRWQRHLMGKLQAWAKAIEEGKRPRLMIFAPPQHGKSTVVSRILPAWLALRHPEWPGFLASYASSLAKGHAAWVRSTLESQAWQVIARGDRLKTKNSELLAFHEGGQILIRGVGGGLTGNPAMWGVIDDPFSNKQEAQSETTRQTVKDWYTASVRTRLAPGAGLILMHTRWHLDDLAGWLLAEAEKNKDADQWEVLIYTATAEQDEPWLERKKGDSLGRYSLDELRAIRATIGESDWNSLYQQQPRDEKSKMFKAEWIKRAKLTKELLASMTFRYLVCDPATTEDAGDYTAVGVLALDALGRLWLLDLRRGQWRSTEECEQILALARKHNALVMWVEGGPIGNTLAPFLEERMTERGEWYSLETVQVAGKGNKRLRAKPLQAWIENSGLWVPEGAPWIPDLVDELVQFPQGRNDDQVDMLSIGALKMRSIAKGEAPPPKPRPQDAARPIPIPAGPVIDAIKELDRPPPSRRSW
jgi:predicted phage terminase large subunit-like protein